MQRFLTTQGTAVEFSSPYMYVHEELGLVERAWQSIERIAIAALRHAPNNCSLSMWFNGMRFGTMSRVKAAREHPRCDDLIISNEQRLTGKLPSYALYGIFLPFYCPIRFSSLTQRRAATSGMRRHARAGT